MCRCDLVKLENTPDLELHRARSDLACKITSGVSMNSSTPPSSVVNRHLPRCVRVFKEFALTMAPELSPNLPT